MSWKAVFLRDWIDWTAPSTYHLPSPAKPYLFFSIKMRIFFKWHTENFHLIDDFLLSLNSGSIIGERNFEKVVLFCHKPPAGIYHSQSCEVYSEESEFVNWHTELIWENQALVKMFMSLKNGIEFGIMKFWERKGSVAFLLQNQGSLHRIISV